MLGTMTSFRLSSPIDFKASSNATVPLDTVKAYLDFRNWLNFFFKS